MIGWLINPKKELEYWVTGGRGYQSQEQNTSCQQSQTREPYTLNGWHVIICQGFLLRYVSNYDCRQGKAAIDHLLSEEPYRTDVRRIRAFYVARNLHHPEGSLVSGYHNPEEIFLNSDYNVLKFARHELGHEICGGSESAADRYAGIRHDWSRWKNFANAIP